MLALQLSAPAIEQDLILTLYPNSSRSYQVRAAGFFTASPYRAISSSIIESSSSILFTRPSSCLPEAVTRDCRNLTASFNSTGNNSYIHTTPTKKPPIGGRCRYGCQAATGLDTRSNLMMLFAFKQIHLRRRKPVHPQEWRCGESNPSPP